MKLIVKKFAQAKIRDLAKLIIDLNQGKIKDPNKSLMDAIDKLDAPKSYTKYTSWENFIKFVKDNPGSIVKASELKVGDKVLNSAIFEDPQFGDFESGDNVVEITKTKGDQIESKISQILCKGAYKLKVGQKIYLNPVELSDETYYYRVG